MFYYSNKTKLKQEEEMTCSYCGKKIENELNIKLLNADGDFVCDEVCKTVYEKKTHFLNNIVTSPEKIKAWLLSKM